MRANDRQSSTVCPVKSAMTPPSIEQHKTFVVKQRNHLGEPDAGWRVAHFLQQFIAPIHETIFLIWIRNNLIEGVRE